MSVELTESSKENEPVTDSLALIMSDLNSFVLKVSLTAETKEQRHLNRALRKTFSQYRRRWTPNILKSLVENNFSSMHPQSSLLLGLLLPELSQEPPKLDESTEMELDEKCQDSPNRKVPKSSINASTSNNANSNANCISEKTTEIASQSTLADQWPEVEIYLSLLVLVYLLDIKKVDEAINLSTSMVDRLKNWNRRTLDSLSAKVYFYFARSYELKNRLAEIRPKLFALHRTATLRHNFEGQTALLNLLLRNFLQYNLYEQADKLVSKIEFKESIAPNNELARYYYYQGRIKIMDPDQYRLAHDYLQQALRKAPVIVARGFRIAVIKLICILQVLLGELPERSLFNQPGLRSALRPYYKLTSAVKNGELLAFQNLVQEYSKIFTHDKTLFLIQRMRSNVIRTGLRRINLSYSRIRFSDICHKLNLDSVEDAEYITSKAIKEGIIDANIEHSDGFIACKPTIDVYSTNEPQEQFRARTQFSLDIHNDAVKAMRYLPESKKVDEDSRSKIKEEEELVAELVDEDDFF